MLIGVLCLIASVGCYSISQLQQHGKLKWQKKDMSFWGENSYLRKYNYNWLGVPQPSGWYYKTFNIRYKERFPLSATFLVFVTDGMHLMQFCYHLFLSASLASFSGINFLWFWPSIPALHALGYRIFQR